MKKYITLTVKQLKEILDFAQGGESDEDTFDTEITIQWHEDEDQGKRGYYAYFSEYPEEDVIGPL